MHFERDVNNVLFINEEESIPAFDTEITDYYAHSFSSLKKNSIRFGNKTYFYKKRNIQKNETITFFVNKKKYTIHLRPDFMPDYTITSTQKEKYGYIFLTPFNGRSTKNSYAYIVDTQGNLLYYRRNKNDNKYVSDFKKTILADNQVRYSLMEQEKPMPPYVYWLGSLLVMDDKFNPQKNLKLKAYNEHNELMVENHDSLIITDNHYILSAYHPVEIFHPETDEPIKVVATILQEIKNNKVVFEWNSTDYPQFIKTTTEKISSNKPNYIDYMHFNSLLIDPKDDNLVLSFATQSSLVKINRKNGKIIWVLGGSGDEFGLSDNMKFSNQHSPLILNSNEIILFDNALTSQKNITKSKNKASSILHLTLDENNKKITKWKRIKLPFYSAYMGSVQITNNQTYFVSGGSNKDVSAMELDKNGQEIWRLSLKKNNTTYRAYKYDTL